MPDPQDEWASTLTLLTRARAGDARALDQLFSRYLPALARWARGRLPRWARDVADTQDLVQEAALATFRNVTSFEHRGEGALLAYLRQAVMNRVRDEVRRVGRRPSSVELQDDVADMNLSPLEQAIGAELAEQYETALGRLADADRELVIARIELRLSYADIAAATGRRSADAARMAVGRALLRVAEQMKKSS